MSSLVSAYTFNELAANDYSGNGYNLNTTSVTYTATTATNGGFGYDANFGAMSNASLGGFPLGTYYTGLTIFFNINFTSLTTQIVSQADIWSVSINATGNIVFRVKASLETSVTLTSAAVLSTATWNSIACVWNGTNQYIYINGVLDSQVASTSLLYSGSETVTVGGSSFVGLLNMLEIRNVALTAAQIGSLAASPGGMLITVDAHNFALGDLIADTSVVSQAVITWVIDQSNFYAYPLTATTLNNLAHYGNVFNTARQSVMEINNNFDGNGNSQISIKYPIASFADYASPANKQSWDYTGFTGIIGTATPQAKTMMSYRL